jgi:hypothetical protein
MVSTCWVNHLPRKGDREQMNRVRISKSLALISILLLTGFFLTPFIPFSRNYVAAPVMLISAADVAILSVLLGGKIRGSNVFLSRRGPLFSFGWAAPVGSLALLAPVYWFWENAIAPDLFVLSAILMVLGVFTILILGLKTRRAYRT